MIQRTVVNASVSKLDVLQYFFCSASIKSSAVKPVLFSSIVKAVNQRFDLESGSSG